MSNISLPVGGRSFVVSCAVGEEAHIEMLGRMLDERAKKMGGAPNEARMLLVIALMLADELHDAHNQLPPPGSEAQTPDFVAAKNLKMAERIQMLADRLEKLGVALEQGADNP